MKQRQIYSLLNKKGMSLLEVVVASVLLSVPLYLMSLSIPSIIKDLKVLRFKQSILQIEDEMKVKALSTAAKFISEANKTGCTPAAPFDFPPTATLQNNLQLLLLNKTRADLLGIDNADPEYAAATVRCNSANTVYETGLDRGGATPPYLNNLNNKEALYFCALIQSAGAANSTLGTVAESKPALVEFLFVAHDLSTTQPVACNTGFNAPGEWKSKLTGSLYYTIHMQTTNANGDLQGLKHYSSKFVSANLN